jgi:hypothetical protein
MTRFLCAVIFAVALIGLSGGVVSADHDHNLITPGTTVVDIGNGQTEKCATDPGGHAFHEHVHLGMPGMKAFENPNNPVSVIKTEGATC